MILICNVSRGKGSWGHITRLINDNSWDAIYLVTNDWCKQNFAPKKEVNWILINRNMGFDLMKKTIKEQLPSGKEIALNIISGDGKEHMALLVSCKEKYSNFNYAILTKDGLKYY